MQKHMIVHVCPLEYPWDDCGYTFVGIKASCSAQRLLPIAVVDQLTCAFGIGDEARQILHRLTELRLFLACRDIISFLKAAPPNLHLPIVLVQGR